MLVPEISLTPQMILRLKRQFGRRVAVQHSASTTPNACCMADDPEAAATSLVGTRSAIFSPLENIG